MAKSADREEAHVPGRPRAPPRHRTGRSTPPGAARPAVRTRRRTAGAAAPRSGQVLRQVLRGQLPRTRTPRVVGRSASIPLPAMAQARFPGSIVKQTSEGAAQLATVRLRVHRPEDQVGRPPRPPRPRRLAPAQGSPTSELSPTRARRKAGACTLRTAASQTQTPGGRRVGPERRSPSTRAVTPRGGRATRQKGPHGPALPAKAVPDHRLQPKPAQGHEDG